MDNLDFRKYLTTYGISLEEYEKMEDIQKKKLIDKFNIENKEKTRAEKADSLDKFGKGLQGCGCLIILIPILIVLIYFIITMIF